MAQIVDKKLLKQFREWLTSDYNSDYTGKEKYSNYDYYFHRLLQKAVEFEIISIDNIDILNIQWLEDFRGKYYASSELKDIDSRAIGHNGGIAALNKFIAFARSLKNRVAFDDDVKVTRYWLYAPGEAAEKWEEFYQKGVMAIGWGEIGDLSSYASKAEMKQKMQEVIDPTLSFMNASHATWQFANEMKPGDIIFVKKGLHMLLGKGVVASDYYYDASCPDEYKHFRKVKWTDKGEWNHPGQAAMKTLTDITPYSDYVKKLLSIFEESVVDENHEIETEYPKYSKKNFLEEVYLSSEAYDTLVELIKVKKNVVLQGAPGVGKTFAAKRLAYSIMGVKDKSRVAFVQFHQSYSYEDFIMGFRPCEKGFELKTGIFYDFCKKAEIDSDNDYFFIIDEINRGNLSKIFGELFMLMENDKRGVEIRLLYADETFSIPQNVYIIGMMNTADRSLAMLDYALRRRFAFYNLLPAFDSAGFVAYRDLFDNYKFNHLIRCVQDLNIAIANDESLGEGFCIGHSYFCNLAEMNDKILSNIVEYELIPLIKEYWFDEPGKIRDWTNKLRGAIL